MPCQQDRDCAELLRFSGAVIRPTFVSLKLSCSDGWRISMACFHILSLGRNGILSCQLESAVSAACKSSARETPYKKMVICGSGYI